MCFAKQARTGVAGSEINVEQRGIYFDEIRKADGAWKFSSRRFVPFLIAPGSVVGQVTASRPLTPPW